MKLSDRVARMKNPAVAAQCRRLCTEFVRADLLPGAAKRPAHRIASRDGQTGVREVLTPRMPVEVSMPDSVSLALRLGAAACRVDEAEFVRQAIAEKAAATGLPALAAQRAFVGVDLARGEDAIAIARREPDGVYTLITNDDGDLLEVPDFQRVAPNQFASGP